MTLFHNLSIDWPPGVTQFREVIINFIQIFYMEQYRGIRLLEISCKSQQTVNIYITAM